MITLLCYLTLHLKICLQVPSLMSVSVTNPGTSAITAGNMAPSRGFVPPLMTIPYYGYPPIPAAASGNQMATAQGNFNSMESNSNASQLVKGQPSHQSQGQRAGQALGPVVQQPNLPGLGQAQGPIPGFFQGLQGLGQPQVHQVPGQSVSKGQTQGQQLQGQIQGQLHGQHRQGQVQGQFQGQRLQGQAQFKTPNQNDAKALPKERKGILGNETPKNSESDQSSAATNQLSHLLPFGAINHPSVYPASPFTMFMTQQFQQQQYQQQYQQMLQASLYQVLGLPTTGAVPDRGGLHSQQGRSASANPYASLMPGSQVSGWPGNGGPGLAVVAGAPGTRLDGLSALSTFGLKPNETASSQILPGTSKESSAQDSSSAWQQHMPNEDGRN